MAFERLSIGEFARRSGLTARALRLYDQRGLLSPVTVDEATGYRYYDSEQLASARLISALRAVAMPLDIVTHVLAADTGEAHAILDRWWAAVDAEHRATAELVPDLHQLLDKGEKAVTDEPPADAEDVPSLLEAVRAATNHEAIPGEEVEPGHLVTVRELIASGADVNATDDDDWTPLHSVAMSDHVDLARLLLDSGARVDAGTHGISGATPLSYALFYAQREVAAVLAAAGMVPDR